MTELTKEGYDRFLETQDEMCKVLRKIFQEYLDEAFNNVSPGYIESNYERMEINSDGVFFGGYSYNHAGDMNADIIIPLSYVYDREAWREEQRVLKERYEVQKKLEQEERKNREINYLKELMKKYPDVKGID
jgi:hypothetical protein